MAKITGVDYASQVKSVHSTRMLKPGGGLGPGGYERRKHAFQTSTKLKARQDDVAARQIACASQTDVCVSRNPKVAASQLRIAVAPDGKRYVACDEAARIARLKKAYSCATQIGGRVAAEPAAPLPY
jgi:hypothetical protein